MTALFLFNKIRPILESYMGLISKRLKLSMTP